MKKMNFMGLMEVVNKKKPNQRTLDLHGDILYPEVGAVESYNTITTFCLTNKFKKKVNAISKKYGISRSAVIRILLENVEV